MAASKAKRIEDHQEDIPLKSEIDETLKSINKEYGNKVVTPGDRIVQPGRISTGIFMLDFCLLGGIPHNRVTQVVGNKHSGKSMVAQKIIASAQRLFPNDQAVLMDIENTYDEVWGAKLGIDNSRLIVARPETGEAAMDIQDVLIRTSGVSLIVVDSIAALTPFKEYDSSAEDAHIGLQARMIGSAVRKAVQAMGKERNRGHFVTVVNVNQFRCLEKSTKVWTLNGLMPISEIKEGDSVHSPSGFAKVKNVTPVEHKDGVTLVIKKYASLGMSNNHRQIVVGADGRQTERLARGIFPSDWVMISTAPNINLPDDPETEKYAEFLGAYFADGCTTKAIRRNGYLDYRVSIGEKSTERHALVKQIMLSLFNGAGGYKNGANTVGAPGKEVIDRYGIGHIGKDKAIPAAILSGGSNTIKKFLRFASFDTHSFQRNKFYWTFETSGQADSFASLLQGFGVKADLVMGRTGRYTYLSLSGSDAVLYRDLIGFAETIKQEKAKCFTNTSSGARGKYDVVPRKVLRAVFDAARERKLKGRILLPNYGTLNMCLFKETLNGSRQRLLDFAIKAAEQDSYFDYWVETLSKYRYAEVLDVVPAAMDTVDIEVEGGLFFANGVLTHNSKIGGWSPNGDPTTTPGGKALGFANTIEVTIKNKEGKAANDGRGVDTIHENEHSFTITKNKLNNGPRTGEFRLRRVSDELTGLAEGDIDEVGTMLAFAKKFGAYTGGGSSWVLAFDDYKNAFRGIDAAVKHFVENDNEKWLLRNYLIRCQAQNVGMPSYFVDRFR